MASSSSSALEDDTTADQVIGGPPSPPPPVPSSSSLPGIQGAPAHVRLPRDGKFVDVPPEIWEYALKMDCPVYQINAQRFFGPPNCVALDWTPEKGSEVFVGRLPRDLLEPELIPWLEQIGPLFQVRLMMDFSGSNKGYCFATYFTKEQADLAVEALHQKDLGGASVVVAKSLDNKKLVLSGVSTDKTEEELRQVVETLSDGVVEDVEVTWQVDGEGNGNPRGVAFVTYQSHREAAIARKKMLQKPLFMWNQRVFADWAETDSGASWRKQGGTGHNILVVHGLAKGTRLQTMWQTFKTLGPFCGVDYIQLTRNKDKAFVYFRRRAQAEVAKVAFDGTEIEGRKVRVGWCDAESAPKRRPARKPRTPMALGGFPLFSLTPSSQPCMDPAHLWMGPLGAGGAVDMVGYQEQQIWSYPQVGTGEWPQGMPQMIMPRSDGGGPMSYVSSVGPPPSSSEWIPASQQGEQVYYQAYQEVPSGTVFYVPVTFPDYQQGGSSGLGSWGNQTEVGGAFGGAAAYPSPYPGGAGAAGVYWTHFTPYDYYQYQQGYQNGGGVEQLIGGNDQLKQSDDKKEGGEEAPGGEGEEGEGANGQGLQSDLFSISIWN